MLDRERGREEHPEVDETVQPVDEYVTRAPARALRPWVGAYSGYRQRGIPPVRHLGLPSPWLTVVITLDDPLHVVSHPDAQQPGGRYDALVGGLHVRPAVIAHGGRQSGMQVALHPLAARSVLGAPAGELAALDLPADAVLGSEVDRLRDRLSVLDWGARFDLLDRWFTDRLSTPSTDLPAGLGTACRRLVGGDGVATVARATGWSARHLTTLVRRETGCRRARWAGWRGSTGPAASCSTMPACASATSPRSRGTATPPTSCATSASSRGCHRRRGGRRSSDPSTTPTRCSRQGRGMTTNSEAPVPTTPVPTVWPAFRARDARALIAFLVDAFGFEETLVVPGEGDLVAHAQLSWPHGGGVMLGSERPGTGWHVGAGGAGCYVVVPDDAALDAVHARARAAGADAGDVVKQGYGSREFTVRDPEGNHWSFGTYRGERGCEWPAGVRRVSRCAGGTRTTSIFA